MARQTGLGAKLLLTLSRLHNLGWVNTKRYNHSIHVAAWCLQAIRANLSVVLADSPGAYTRKAQDKPIHGPHVVFGMKVQRILLTLIKVKKGKTTKYNFFCLCVPVRLRSLRFTQRCPLPRDCHIPDSAIVRQPDFYILGEKFIGLLE